ncbi:MAG TPA: M48 family metalloprotease [Oligoflexus sp.]|uniref:M48 family metalloprotease n=1 Tax=Oligoflexus sp. TaxID=1971216 RepID=UPI002D808B38|nr:M48 family metalloprotease [Oligoflexus sp.]HET9239061.1 M48 family metalloprotease [Oligoflexus sp.]
MRRTTRLFLCLSSLQLQIACQPASQSSSLDHTFGQTTRPRAALKACEKGDANAPAILYMQTLFQKLVTSNSGTFQGPLAPANFCLRLDQDDEINGLAYIENGEIHLTKGLIMAVDHDADIAAVLAHELAHITMDHRYDLEHEKVVAGSKVTELKAELAKKQDEYREGKAAFYPDLIAALKKDPTLLDAIAALKGAVWLKSIVADMRSLLTKVGPTLQEKAGLLDDVTSLRDHLKYDDDDRAVMEKNATWNDIIPILDRSDLELMAVRSRMSELNQALRDIPREDLIQDGPGAASNWKEQEADEVGYEFYLRAGFRPDRFTSIHNVLMAQSRSDGECSALQAKGQLPPRGAASHPSSCWRIYNISQREAMAHAEAYKPFMNNSLLSLTVGALEEVKKGL